MYRRSIMIIALVFACIAVTGCHQAEKAEEGLTPPVREELTSPVREEPTPPVIEEPTSPAVMITLIPPRGEGEDSQGNIAGTVTGVATPQNHKIVVYARTNQWYVQPLIDAPYTPIKDNGTWNNWTHLGHRYAALLVRPSFQPEAALIVLPEVGGDVIDKTEVAAQ